MRLGRRAVGPLLAAWRRADLTPAARANMVTALGRIGDPAALSVLRESVRHSAAAVREAALLALGDLDNPETAAVLARVLLDQSETVGARAAAAAALGRLTCPEAAEPLLTKLAEVHAIDGRYHENAKVRKEVVRAVGNHLGRRRRQGDKVNEWIDRAVRHLLADGKNSSLLEDVYLRVRNKTAGALAQLGDARAVAPLIERIGDGQFQNPKLVHDTILGAGRAVPDAEGGGDSRRGRSPRAAALAELSRQSCRRRRTNRCGQAAARALGLCEAVERKEELIAAFKAALTSTQEDLAVALKEGAVHDRRGANGLLDGPGKADRLARSLLPPPGPAGRRTGAGGAACKPPANWERTGDERGLKAAENDRGQPGDAGGVA